MDGKHTFNRKTGTVTVLPVYFASAYVKLEWIFTPKCRAILESERTVQVSLIHHTENSLIL